jgi:hypothetical protein
MERGPAFADAGQSKLGGGMAEGCHLRLDLSSKPAFKESPETNLVFANHFIIGIYGDSFL